MGYILVFYLMASAVIPCSVLDNCEDEVKTAHQYGPEGKEHECKNCSPFSICSPLQGFYPGSISYTANLHLTVFEIDYNHFIAGLVSDYYPTLLQPPRC